ncbi:MAG: hypothetical protein R3330_12595, partial [Saprospiraceae bacterium]|nr:hypothetical protein [Saprospiraceae bacterium]
MRLATAFILLLFSSTAFAQTSGYCLPGRAEATLDIGDVRATVFNNGSLFFGDSGPAQYIVPESSGVSPFFAAGLWVGGLVEGELRFSGETYTDFQYWPGSIDESDQSPTACLEYDRIYVVTRGDIQRYLDAGIASPDLMDWPFELGAPVLDGDGDPSNYNIEEGDQPAVWGEQMAWWVMNDVAGQRTEDSTDPNGIQVQTQAFAVPEGPEAFLQATFYRYKITYLGEQPLENAYVSLWSDPDLGGPADDRVGVDTTFGTGFTYNADDFDEDFGPSWPGYGVHPPAAGFQLLDGVVGLPNGRDDDSDGHVDEPDEDVGLTSFAMLYEVGYPIGDPQTPQQMYLRMQGLWSDGRPFEEGGDGYMSGGPATKYMFAGDPVAGDFWSEVNCDGAGTPCDNGGDRRFMMTTGPFRMEHGDE